MKILARNSARLEVVPQHRRVLRPVLLVRDAHDVEDLVQLIHLVLSGKERLSEEELGEDAAAGPDVDGGRVGDAHQDLRGPIPESDNL